MLQRKRLKKPKKKRTLSDLTLYIKGDCYEKAENA